RIPAPRPGLTETPRRFTAGPGHRCNSFIFLKQPSSLSVKKLLGIPQPTGREKKHRTKFTILSRFLSKNEWLLAIHFNSFIKIPPPEILPS
ncbi:hypothetical protein ACVGWK_01285, partial [Enterobacter sichuanensis]